MRERDYIEKWCPSARVLQQSPSSPGHVETGTRQAYNRSTLEPNPTGQDGVLSAAATCLGSMCAVWKPSFFNFLQYVPVVGYFYQPRGRCGHIK